MVVKSLPLSHGVGRTWGFYAAVSELEVFWGEFAVRARVNGEEIDYGSGEREQFGRPGTHAP